MTSDSGSARQDTDYARHIQETLHELHQLQQTPRLVTSPDALEALEREIRQRTDYLGSLLVGYHLQHALDSTALRAEQAQLVSHWPKPLKNDGKVEVRIRTAQGHTVPVWVTYYRHKGQRRAGKRDAGVYAGLVLLGIYDRCTPALAAEVSLLAAMLGSLAEAQESREMLGKSPNSSRMACAIHLSLEPGEAPVCVSNCNSSCVTMRVMKKPSPMSSPSTSTTNASSISG